MAWIPSLGKWTIVALISVFIDPADRAGSCQEYFPGYLQVFIRYIKTDLVSGLLLFACSCFFTGALGEWTRAETLLIINSSALGRRFP
jgi:hypothetical protein